MNDVWPRITKWDSFIIFFECSQGLAGKKLVGAKHRQLMVLKSGSSSTLCVWSSRSTFNFEGWRKHHLPPKGTKLWPKTPWRKRSSWEIRHQWRSNKLPYCVGKRFFLWKFQLESSGTITGRTFFSFFSLYYNPCDHLLLHNFFPTIMINWKFRFKKIKVLHKRTHLPHQQTCAEQKPTPPKAHPQSACFLQQLVFEKSIIQNSLGTHQRPHLHKFHNNEQISQKIDIGYFE